MLVNHIVSKLFKSFEHKPTKSQEKLFEALALFISTPEDGLSLIVKGYAGTGKTSVIGTFVKCAPELGLKTVLLAPTGRAAKVLSGYSKKNAHTIHRKIYRQVSSKDGFGKFMLDRNLHTNTVFIIDEASMISNQRLDYNAFGSGYLLNDLLEFIQNNKMCKAIIVGDTAQLPPVGLDVSPAMEKEEISLMSNCMGEYFLSEVVRQHENSCILENAHKLRLRLEDEDFSLPLLQVDEGKDLEILTGEYLIERLTESYDRVGIEESLVVCRSNKRANKYNQGIRSQVLWREEELVPGDLLMVVKNNYFWLKDEEDSSQFIANGDIIEIIRVRKYEELYGFRFVNCLVRLIDYHLEVEVKLLIESLNSESASMSADDNKKLYYEILEDYSDLKPKKKQYQSVRENEFFNALQVKYAYAVTCHKSQGGQWKHVYIDAGYLKEDMVDRSYIRWLYTALTRATEKAYLVNFPKDFVSLKE